MKKSKHLEILAAHVACGKTIRESAELIGISEATAYAVSSSDDFRDAVSRLRTEAISQAVAVLSSNAKRASDALVKLLDSADEKVVLASSVKLLTMLQPLQELAELRERVSKIEAQASLRIVR